MFLTRGRYELVDNSIRQKFSECIQILTDVGGVATGTDRDQHKCIPKEGDRERTCIRTQHQRAQVRYLQ